MSELRVKRNLVLDSKGQDAWVSQSVLDFLQQKVINHLHSGPLFDQLERLPLKVEGICLNFELNLLFLDLFLNFQGFSELLSILFMEFFVAKVFFTWG